MQKRNILSSKDIGLRIKHRRKALGISQEKLAEMIGVSFQQIQRYENGVNKLNTESIQIIANALSVPLSYFFESWHKVKEQAAFTLSSDEIVLLKRYRQVKSKASKNVVLQVAKFATRT